MLLSQAKAKMWYNLGVGFWTKFLKYGLPPLPIPVNQLMPLGGFGDFCNFYNYISRWTDAIDVVVGSIKKLWMLLLCLAW